MQTVKVSSKGQIVIPKSIREARYITVGTEFVIRAVGDELRLIPLPTARKTSIEDAAGILHRPGRKYLSEEKTRRAVGKLFGTKDSGTVRR
jgi:AbrB family looped-hinge helix DNA binding protein